MPSHVTKTRWLIETRSLQLKIYPRDRPKHCWTNTKKTNGGTLRWKNIIFQKSSPIFFKTLPNDSICHTDSEKVYNLGSVHPLRTVHTLCTLRKPCTERAQTLGMFRPQVIYLFGISLINAVTWACFEKDQRWFLKKKYFFIQGSPLWFFGYLSDSVLADPGGKY